MLSYGIPSLDDFAPLHPDRPAIVVIALPWQPASETPFVVTQAFARQGYRPLCVHRGWSPHWDGPWTVHTPTGSPRRPTVDYDAVRALTEPGQPVVVDQFHLFHWDAAKRHQDRTAAVAEAGRQLRTLAALAAAPVVVFTERRSRDGAAMSAQDLRSDGALSGEADMLLMVDPKYKKGTADLLVVENWQGPTGEFPGVAWPELPRTAARRSD